MIVRRLQPCIFSFSLTPLSTTRLTLPFSSPKTKTTLGNVPNNLISSSSITPSTAKMASPIAPQQNGAEDVTPSYKPRYIDVRSIPSTASNPINQVR